MNFSVFCYALNFSLSLPYKQNNKITNESKTERRAVWDDLKHMSIKTYSWFCYKVYERPLKILLFKTSDNMAGFVLEHFESLFPENIMQVEDICFFKGSKLTFGSVMHENIAQLIDPDEEIMDIYEKYGRWDRVILTERDMEYIPDLNGII